VSTDSEDENWPLLVADILGAAMRLEEAKAAVAEAEGDLATCVRVLKGLIAAETIKSGQPLHDKGNTGG
jgi:hypothetical protein